MIADDNLLQEFVTESIEHLSGVEGQLLEIEAAGANIDVELVNDVFRAIHSIKGAAGFLGLSKINELSHSLENVLNQIRNKELVPDKAVVDVLLRSSDQLLQLVADLQGSENAEISSVVNELEAIYNGETPAGNQAEAAIETELAVAAAAENSDEATSESSEASPESSTVQPTAAATPATNSEKAAAPPAQKPPAAQPPEKKATTHSTAESSVRVSVSVLDQLMNLAGELVLGRNQLLQSLQAESEQDQLEAVALRIDHVTSEIQAAIMKTRMQPVGNVFNKFNRIVRDLSNKLGKSANLTIEGNDVEVDKTIVEAIGDPLTHLIRNSVDHGLETTADRKAAGKPAEGSIHLKAYHQSGKVRIEITDDGKGINHEVLREKAIEKGLFSREQAMAMNEKEAIRLIFHPGFSMAKEVTDISGRGVGMDVVRSNIEKIGGTVDIETEIGKGTSVIVSLPLTLAIIPSLIVESGGYRFAIPQVNIAELVRVNNDEADEKIGKLKNKEVLRLRGSLLPLVHLNQAIGNATSEKKPEENSRNIIVVESGALKYGLVVDNLFDSEEIVVKPLGRHLKNLASLSGATILGDGTVALILDVGGIASRVSLRIGSEGEGDPLIASKSVDQGNNDLNILLFSNGKEEQFAIPMESVARIERICSDQVQCVGGQELMHYRGGTLPLLSLERYIDVQPRDEQSRVYVVVFMIANQEIGIVAPELLDIRETSAEFDQSTLNETAVLGTQVINEAMTRLLDMRSLAQAARPDWFISKPRRNSQSGQKKTENRNRSADSNSNGRVLLAEDSTFFRKKVQSYLEDHGFEVMAAEDGAEAWSILDRRELEADLVITDIEMPKMNGLELARIIRSDDRFADVPIIALTSLAGENDARVAFDAGVDDYQIKLDHEQLSEAIGRLLPTAVGFPALATV